MAPFVGAAPFRMDVVPGVDADGKTTGAFLLFHLVHGAMLVAWAGYSLPG